MATDHAASVQGVALRATKLAPSGAPLVGTDTSFVTNAFISMSFTPEYLEGEEIEQPGADGSVCVYYKVPDVLKRVTFSLSVCAPDPELNEILVGGTILESSPSNPVGYAAPEGGIVATPDGISLELWSRAIVAGKPAAVNPFWRWVFPYAQLVFDGERTMENGLLANEFSGYGVGNVEWGDGPQNDWDYTSGAAFQYARAADFPSGINGYQAVVADSV